MQTEFGAASGGMLFYGGLFAARAYQEAKLCYMNACFVACVVLCEMVLEHTLAATFALDGRNDLSGAPFSALLREALREGRIDQGQYDALDRYRTVRNAYVHNRDDRATIDVSRRAAESGTTVLEVYEQDARLALTAMHRLVRAADDRSQ